MPLLQDNDDDQWGAEQVQEYITARALCAEIYGLRNQEYFSNSFVQNYAVNCRPRKKTSLTKMLKQTLYFSCSTSKLFESYAYLESDETSREYRTAQRSSNLNRAPEFWTEHFYIFL